MLVHLKSRKAYFEFAACKIEISFQMKRFFKKFPVFFIISYGDSFLRSIARYHAVAYPRGGGRGAMATVSA